MPETPATSSSNPSLTALLPLKLDTDILPRALRFWRKWVLTDPGKGVSLGYINKQTYWSASSVVTVL